MYLQLVSCSEKPSPFVPPELFIPELIISIETSIAIEIFGTVAVAKAISLCFLDYRIGDHLQITDQQLAQFL